MEREQAILLHSADDVIIAKENLAPDAAVRATDTRVQLRESIRAGHKIARRFLGAGSPVRRYGQVIGYATQDIQPGALVHVHNLEAGDGARDYQAGAEAHPVAFYPPEQLRTFEGYARPDGRVGTRNYVAIVS